MNLNLLSEQYLGVPNLIWEECCHQVEEMLYDEDIGQHIVGLYPSAPRIYGNENAKTSLLCLYVDCSDSILDPLYVPKFDHTVDLFESSEVQFINLFEWIKTLTNININHLTPCFGDSFYQDESINRIIFTAQEYLLNVDFNHNKASALEERTLKIFRYIRKFLPSINPEYGEVFNLRELVNYMRNYSLPKEDKYLLKQVSNAAIEYFRYLV